MADKDEGHWDTAQICLNGHQIVVSIKDYPERMSLFCGQCGEPTITTCKKCNAEIRGRWVRPWAQLELKTVPPGFCHNCGSPYPWTERRLQAARDFANEIEAISQDDRSILTDNLEYVVKDTARTEVAATRVKKVLAKAGKEGTDFARRVLVDLVTETAKKIIFPQ